MEDGKPYIKLSWHMIFRAKRLDDNGPMGASLIELQLKYPHKSFLNYINETTKPFELR